MSETKTTRGTNPATASMQNTYHRGERLPPRRDNGASFRKATEALLKEPAMRPSAAIHTGE